MFSAVIFSFFAADLLRMDVMQRKTIANRENDEGERMRGLLNILDPLKNSLRNRLIISIGTMLLPLVVFAIVGYSFFINAVNVLEKTRTESFGVVITIVHLEKNILEAAMPPNDYLVNGNPDEKKNFNNLVREVEAHFDAARKAPFQQEQERTLVGAAYDEWLAVKSMGEKLFAYDRPIGNRAARAEMKLFDRKISVVSERLHEVHAIIQAELKNSLDEAHAAKMQVQIIVILIFAVGVLILLVVGVFLARSILRPVKALEAGTKQFSGGDLSARVNVMVSDELGHLITAFNSMADQIEKNQNALKELSIRDGLTGLYNKREFLGRLTAEVDRSIRYEQLFSLIMVDIDFFKKVNDTYGHLCGDDVLRTMAAFIKKNMRAVDCVARYGGEEIAVIMPNSPIGRAVIVAERCRQLVAQYSFVVAPEQAISLTISLGVAAFPRDGRTGEELIAAADSALYHAKHSGRNCVRQSGSP